MIASSGTCVQAFLLAGLLIVAIQAATDGPSKPTCRSWSGLDGLLAPGRVVLVGESHGTAESPAFVGDLACYAARAGRRLTLGLEIPRTEQERLDAFLASSGDGGARRVLLAGQFWTRDDQDGRARRAMVDLLEALRGLRSAGADVEVVAFDVDGPSPNRDADMGRALARAAGGERRLLVALSGNYHNRLAVGAPWEESWRPMGLFVRDELPDRTVVSLDVAHAGGEAWICTGPAVADCGPLRLAGASDRRGAIDLFESVQEGHSGRYHVGPLTASGPRAGAPLSPLA